MVRLPCLQTRTAHNGAAHRFGSQMTHQMTTQGGRADEWHLQRVGQAAVESTHVERQPPLSLLVSLKVRMYCRKRERRELRAAGTWKRFTNHTAGARNPSMCHPVLSAHARAGRRTPALAAAAALARARPRARAVRHSRCTPRQAMWSFKRHWPARHNRGYEPVTALLQFLPQAHVAASMGAPVQRR